MIFKITDSKDLKIFRRVRDDSSGKAVKTLIKMILGQSVKDSTIGEKFKIVLFNQNRRPEMFSNVLKNKSEKDKFKDMISGVKFDAEELASAVNVSNMTLYKWHPDKDTDSFISIKTKDGNGNELTLRIVK